jgi:hypothetical protein
MSRALEPTFHVKQSIRVRYGEVDMVDTEAGTPRRSFMY